MTKYKTLGYQVLIELDEVQTEIISKDKIIIASGTESHKLRSGIIIDIGSLALKEDPELEIGDRIHFLESDLNLYSINGDQVSVVHTSAIKVIEKSEK